MIGGIVPDRCSRHTGPAPALSIDQRVQHRYDRRSMSEASAFTGFSEDGIEFLRDLAAHNDRTWFQQRKADYERLLQEYTYLSLTDTKPPPQPGNWLPLS